MDILLIDYQPRGATVNREQTGTYGSRFHARGPAGIFLSRLKGGNVRLPLVSFSLAGAVFQSGGHTVRMTHGMPEQGADVAFFATAMYHWRNDVAFLAALRERHPDMRVGVAGAFSGAMPHLYRDVADFVVEGELEAAALACAEGREDFSGTVVSHGFVDVNRLPLPDWSAFPLKRYSYRPMLPREPFLPVQTSRGCPRACPFCPYIPAQGTRLRKRHVNTVERELRMLQEEHGVRSVLFRDPIFTVSARRTRDLCSRIAGLPGPLDWACETTVDDLTAELVDHMAGAGLRAVNLGVESADMEVLEKSGKKRYNPEHLETMVERLHDRGVAVQAFYMLGLWDDTPETMERTLELARDLNTYTAQFCVATPFPGTAWFRLVREHLAHEDWEQFTEYRPVLEIPGATAGDIRRTRDRAYATYYFRPRWLLRHGFRALCGFFHGFRGM
ncbi:MAG: B12-binding domain-containing radical SAM protein [Desulfatibacillaceae bacterium]